MVRERDFVLKIQVRRVADTKDELVRQKWIIRK